MQANCGRLRVPMLTSASRVPESLRQEHEQEQEQGQEAARETVERVKPMVPRRSIPDSISSPAARTDGLLRSSVEKRNLASVCFPWLPQQQDFLAEGL